VSGKESWWMLGNVIEGIRRPGKILPYLKRTYCTIEGSVIVWPWRGQVVLEPFYLPRPRANEFIVQNDVTLVSPGTERAFLNHLPNTNTSYPFHPGYSGAGRVIMTGKHVTQVKTGDRVALQSGHKSIVLAREDQVVSVPEAVSLEQAAFIQLAIIALQGVRKARLRVGDSVAILGQGLIGQLVTQMVAASGAYPIVAVAASASRRERAMQSGAHVFLSVQHDWDGLGTLGADAVIEASGNPAAIPIAVQCVRPGGRIVLLGSTRGVCQALDLQLIGRKNIILLGAHIDGLPGHDALDTWWPAKKELSTFWDLLRAGRLDVDGLVTDHVYPCEAEWFYRRLSKGDRGILGALFRWDALPQRMRAHPRSFLVSIPDIQKSRDVPSSSNPRLLLNSAEKMTPYQRPAYTKMKEMIMRRANGVLKVGLVGCGEIAVQNARAVHNAPNAIISVVMDVQEKVAEDLGNKYKVPYTTDLDQVLSSDVDAVLISVPHYLHAPLAIQAIEAGKHIMVEKPMALTTEEARSVMEAAQKANVGLSTIYCQRYQSYVQRAKDLMMQGALGRVLGVSLTFEMDKPVSYWTGGYSGRVLTDWRASKDKSGGGIFIFSMVHYLDIIHYLTELRVSRVFSEYGTLDTPVETEDTISVTLRYENQAIGTILASTCVRGTDGSTNLHIWGENGHLKLKQPLEFFSLCQVESYKPSAWHVLDDTPIVNDRAVFVTRFANSVLTGTESDVTPEDNIEVQSIVDAVYESGELGRSVEVHRR
jgi:2-desacetyl-2-hydroxyethyl bacteriochlorophyllide A dehydrogenase